MTGYVRVKLILTKCFHVFVSYMKRKFPWLLALIFLLISIIYGLWSEGFFSKSADNLRTGNKTETM